MAHAQTRKGFYDRRSANSFAISAADDNYTDLEMVHKFGHSYNISTSFTPVATADVYPTPSSLTSLEILSDDADDTSAGDGARTVTIEGIGTDWALASETVSMNGTTAVALSNQYYRVFRLTVATSGTYATAAAGSHQGTITLRVASAGATWAQIETTGFPRGQSEIACYTVPAGKQAIVVSAFIASDSSKNVECLFFQRPNCDTVSAPYEPMRVVWEVGPLAAPENVHPVTGYGPFVGPCDLGFMAKGSGAGSEVNVDFEIALMDAR